MRTIVVRGINISLHDTKHDYIELMRAAYRLGRPIQVLGDQHLLIRSMQARRTDDEVFLHGTIARFTRIDPKAPWFSTRSMNQATTEEKESIEIPPYLHPNLRSYSYIFFPSTHKLAFEAKGKDGTLGIRSVQTLFEQLMSRPEIFQKFGGVEINPVLDSDKIDHLFDLKTIRKISIKISKPNPDDYPEDLEEEIKEDLEKENADRVTRILEAARTESLTPSDDTKLLALVASRNGNVTVDGSDAHGVPETRQLDEYPLEAAHRYDPEGDGGQWPAFLIAAREFYRRSRRKR